MAKVQFKAKVQEIFFSDGRLYRRFVKIPKLARRHCDMPAFRSHPRYGAFANSDLFPSILERVRRGLGGQTAALDLNALPDNVTVDSSGFLALVTIDVP